MSDQQDNPTLSQDEDVEGHVKLPGVAVQPQYDEDDVEGHKMPPNRGGLQPEDDEDDVEGHRVL